MAFIFQNIPQLANSTVSKAVGSKANSSVSNNQNAGSIDFESVFASLLNPSSQIALNNQTMAVLASGQKINSAFVNNMPMQPMAVSNISLNPLLKLDSAFGLETKEKASIGSQVLKAILSTNKDVITLEIPQSLVSNPSQPQMAGNLQLPKDEKPLDIMNQVFSPKEIAQPTSANQVISLKFRPSDLFAPNVSTGRDNVPIALYAQNGTERQGQISPAQLMNLLEDYPDPISIEIGNINNIIATSDNIKSDKTSPKSNSSFTFDLRDLAATSKNQTDTQIDGILKSAEKPEFGSNVIKNIVFDKANEPLSIAPKYDFAMRGYKPDFDFFEKVPVNLSMMTAKPSPTKNHLDGDQPIQIENNINDNQMLTNPNRSTKPAANQTNCINKQDIEANNKNLLSNDNNSKPEQHFDNSNSEISTPANSQEIAESSQNVKPRQHLHSEQAPISQKAISDEFAPVTDKSFIKIETTSQMLPDSQPQNIDMASKIEDIKSAIAAAIDKQMSTVKIKLQPESLGSINVKMTWKNSDLTIGLRAENKDTAGILTSNLTQLKGGLESANLRIHEINVTVDDNHQNNNSNSQNFSNNSHGNNRGGQKNADNPEFSKFTSTARSPFQSASMNPSMAVNPRGWIDLKA